MSILGGAIRCLHNHLKYNIIQLVPIIEKREVKVSVLVGKKAIDFNTTAVMPDNSINENFSLKSYLDKSYGILFFYPLNFTFVCPSEIISFDNASKEFEKRNTKVVGVSIDSPFCHIAYKDTDRNNGGIGKVKFPLVSDISQKISSDYDVLSEGGIAFRGTFLIDRDFNVRHQVINDLPLGRSIKETIRMIDALTFHESHGEVCPANWDTNSPAMKATKDGVREYLKNNASKL